MDEVVYTDPEDVLADTIENTAITEEDLIYTTTEEDLIYTTDSDSEDVVVLEGDVTGDMSGEEPSDNPDIYTMYIDDGAVSEGDPEVVEGTSEDGETKETDTGTSGGELVDPDGVDDFSGELIFYPTGEVPEEESPSGDDPRIYMTGEPQPEWRGVWSSPSDFDLTTLELPARADLLEKFYDGLFVF